MPGIKMDTKLLDMGLREEIFCQALHISEETLNEHTITIKLSQKKKKRNRVFSEFVVILNQERLEVPFGSGGYGTKYAQLIIDNLREYSQEKTTKLIGSWPKEEPFLLWFNKRKNLGCIPGKSKEQRKNRQKQEEKAGRAKNLILFSLSCLDHFRTLVISVDKVEMVMNFMKKNSGLLTEKEKKIEDKHGKTLSTYLDFFQTDFSSIIETADENEGETISLWGKKQELLAQVDVKAHQVQYQGVKLTKSNLWDSYHVLNNLENSIREKEQRLRFQEYIAQISTEMDNEIRQIQEQSLQDWDKVYLLSPLDRQFLSHYGEKNFYIAKIFTPSYEELFSWIEGWKKRVKEAFLSPLSIKNSSTSIILGLVSSSPNYGTTTYAMWLSKSQAEILKSKNLSPKYRHLLSDLTIEVIAQKIKELIKLDFLKVKLVGTHKLPVLIVPKIGKKVLNEKDVSKPKNAPLLREKTTTSEKINLLTSLKKGKHLAWIEFLRSPQQIQKLGELEEKKVLELRKFLDKKMIGWQTLACWELTKHPRKYKPLERLLSESLC